jgi:hypothetical protein
MRGVFKPKYGGQWVTSHPDTGVVFSETTVPMWPEVLELCRRAARMFPGIRSIGWDLVVSPDGPIFLEGNDEWDMLMVQVHTDGWLAQPGIREDLMASGIVLPDHVPSTLETVAQIAARKAAKAGERISSWSR